MSFHLASETYAQAASLQRSLVHALAKELYSLVIPAQARISITACAGSEKDSRLRGNDIVLDAGCGTGFFAEWSQQEALPWHIVGLDAAFGMCQKARAKSAVMQASIEHPPLAEGTLDGIFCASALQWVNDWPQTFATWHRLLKPRRWVALSAFTEGTLEELRHAFAQIDDYSHLLHFRSAESLFETLREAGFSLRYRSHHLHYEPTPDLSALLARLRLLGATGKSGPQRKGLMTPRQRERLEQAYKRHAATPQGLRTSWAVTMAIATKREA